MESFGITDKENIDSANISGSNRKLMVVTEAYLIIIFSSIVLYNVLSNC